MIRVGLFFENGADGLTADGLTRRGRRFAECAELRLPVRLG